MLHLPHFHPGAKRLSRQARQTLHAFNDYVARRRPAWMASLAIGEASLSEGLRAACAATAMLLLGIALERPDFAWAAIGAFWTCLADAGGSNRMRLASMMGFTVLSTVCGGATVLASQAGWLVATAAVLLFSCAGALARIWGGAASQVGILAATACVVMVDHPRHHPQSSLSFLVIYLLGCLCATALSLSVWRIHPFGPSRFALRAAYARLAGIARHNAKLLQAGQSGERGTHAWRAHGAGHRARARAAIETARKALAAIPAAHSELSATYDNLVIALANADRVFAYLIAISDACEREHGRLLDAQHAARCLSGIAELLRRIGVQLNQQPRHAPVALQRRLARLGRGLEASLGDLLPLTLHAEPIALGIERGPDQPWREASRTALAQAWLELKANASRRSVGLRHAARVGAATTAAFLIVGALRVPFGYWATMATLLILQPSIGTTWPRAIERAVGSIVGALLAALIGMLIDSPLGISIVVFPLICATMALRQVSYSLYALFLTPAFVLVADFAEPANEFFYAACRLGNNVLGCLIALLATFYFWPTREQDDSSKRLAEAAAANLAYLRAALASGGKWDSEVARLRRGAGLASNNAEQVCNRLRLERRAARGDSAVLRALPLLRRMAGTAARISLGTGSKPADAALLDWSAAVGDEIARLLRGGAVDSAAQAAPPVEELSLLQADAVGQIVLLRELAGEQAAAIQAATAPHQA